MAHTDSERNWCQEPGWNKDKKHYINLECDTVARHGGWLMPAHREIFPRHKEMLSPYRGETHYHKSPPRGHHITINQHLPGDRGHREALSSLAGMCEHLHFFTTFTRVQNRVMLRKKAVFVAASSSSGNWRWVFSRQQAQLGLTCMGVIPVSIKIGDAKVTPNPCHLGLAVLVCAGQAFQLPTSISNAGLYGENTGEGSHTLQQKDSALWHKNSESFLNTKHHFWSSKPTDFSFYCWFLVYCCLLLLLFYSPPGHPVHLCPLCQKD